MSQALVLPENDACAFCDYLSGKRPYTILRRDDWTATLVTREQRGRPHLLVIPIAHRASLLDLHESEAEALMLAVRDAARLIDRAYQRPGIAVWQNNGVDADQTISHLHFHVAGTLDEGGTERGEVEELSLEATEAIARRLLES
ncbi:histidine triad (HIT) family protein [Xanthomonas arboricola]|uniref:HIT family protein n=1 Tax=Xanthomonas euroxanthea TaxID=2259622 RepID=UPI00161E2619|nr:HIT family protein [Xanthomonas euroxanthea]MBB3815357.1 histidine triad (HIT) family protein [Xanthomonas euroxanthea]